MNDGIYSVAIVLLGLGDLGLAIWMFKAGTIKDCLIELETRLNRRIDSVTEDLGKKIDITDKRLNEKIEILDKRIYNHVSEKENVG